MIRLSDHYGVLYFANFGRLSRALASRRFGRWEVHPGRNVACCYDDRIEEYKTG